MRLDGKVAALARRQHGVVSLEQLNDLGITRAMRRVRLKSGEWKELLPGVYLIGGAPDSWHQRAQAALLWAGEDSALSHEAAAYLHGWRHKPPKEIHIVVASNRGLRHPDVVVHRSVNARPSEWSDRGELRITSGARTLIDLAGKPKLQQVVDSAVHFSPHVRPWTLRLIRKNLARGYPGISKLRAMLSAYDVERERADSETENILRRILKQAGVPAAHHLILTREDGSYLLETDFAWSDQKVLMELDGWRHDTPEAKAHRKEVMQECAAMGWRLIPVSNDDVRERPEKVVSDARRALRMTVR